MHLKENTLCLREISINVNKLLALMLLPVLLIRYFFILHFVVACLFVKHVNEPIIFVFGTFVYHFKNTISIFVTIYWRKKALQDFICFQNRFPNQAMIVINAHPPCFFISSILAGISFIFKFNFKNLFLLFFMYCRDSTCKYENGNLVTDSARGCVETLLYSATRRCRHQYRLYRCSEPCRVGQSRYYAS